MFQGMEYVYEVYKEKVSAGPLPVFLSPSRP